MNTIIDTHAHLDHVPEIEKVLKEAASAGVEGIVAVSEDLNSAKKNLEIKLRTKSPKVFLAVGMHPSEADITKLDELIAFIRVNRKEISAIGEIGLDFWYKWVKKDDAKKEEQKKIYRRLLELALEFDLAVSIHSRGAWRECLEIAQEVGIKKAVFHWYSGPVDILKEILSQGYFISATPSLAYSPQAKEAVLNAPVEQILIETDSPVRYKDNNSSDEGFFATPKDVFKTLKLICQIKNLKESEALGIFNSNAKKLFAINY